MTIVTGMAFLALFNYATAVWEPVREVQGVSSYSWQQPESGLYVYRSIGSTYGDVDQVAQAILDVDRRQTLIPELIENFVIEDVSPTERIEYMSLAAPAPVKDRDFVYRSTVEVDAERHTTTVRFTSLPGRDRETDQFVRGRVLDLSFELTQEGPGVTRIDARAALDPRGAIPLEIAAMVERNAPINAILGIRRLMSGQYSSSAGPAITR